MNAFASAARPIALRRNAVRADCQSSHSGCVGKAVFGNIHSFFRARELAALDHHERLAFFFDAGFEFEHQSAFAFTNAVVGQSLAYIQNIVRIVFAPIFEQQLLVTDEQIYAVFALFVVVVALFVVHRNADFIFAGGFHQEFRRAERCGQTGRYVLIFEHQISAFAVRRNRFDITGFLVYDQVQNCLGIEFRRAFVIDVVNNRRYGTV